MTRVGSFQAGTIVLTVSACGPGWLVRRGSLFMSATRECLWCATLGKRLVGGRIKSVGQHRPSTIRILVRNAVKFLVVLAPPLGLVVFMNPHMRGLKMLRVERFW